MTAKEFLKSKHMLREGEDTYPINSPVGRVDLIELLNEYINVSRGSKANERAKTGQRAKPSKTK